MRVGCKKLWKVRTQYWLSNIIWWRDVKNETGTCEWAIYITKYHTDDMQVLKLQV